ncbi:MAG: hypothetical protein K2V38_06435, partial [Gemmataceae bacterium]|nr:hypothetical protein [Gemmataceae bacterium]
MSNAAAARRGDRRLSIFAGQSRDGYNVPNSPPPTLEAAWSMTQDRPMGQPSAIQTEDGDDPPDDPQV